MFEFARGPLFEARLFGHFDPIVFPLFCLKFRSLCHCDEREPLLLVEKLLVLVTSIVLRRVCDGLLR